MYVCMDGCILYCSNRRGLDSSVGDQIPVGARFPAFFIITVETWNMSVYYIFAVVFADRVETLIMYVYIIQYTIVVVVVVVVVVAVPNDPLRSYRGNANEWGVL